MHGICNGMNGTHRSMHGICSGMNGTHRCMHGICSGMHGTCRGRNDFMIVVDDPVTELRPLIINVGNSTPETFSFAGMVGSETSPCKQPGYFTKAS